MLVPLGEDLKLFGLCHPFKMSADSSVPSATQEIYAGRPLNTLDRCIKYHTSRDRWPGWHVSLKCAYNQPSFDILVLMLLSADQTCRHRHISHRMPKSLRISSSAKVYGARPLSHSASSRPLACLAPYLRQARFDPEPREAQPWSILYPRSVGSNQPALSFVQLRASDMNRLQGLHIAMQGIFGDSSYSWLQSSGSMG